MHPISLPAFSDSDESNSNTEDELDQDEEFKLHRKSTDDIENQEEEDDEDGFPGVEIPTNAKTPAAKQSSKGAVAAQIPAGEMKNDDTSTATAKIPAAETKNDDTAAAGKQPAKVVKFATTTAKKTKDDTVAPKQSSKVAKVAKGKAVKKKKRFLIAYGCPEFGVRGKVCDDDDDGALLPPTVVPIPSQVGSNDDSLKKIITASCSTVMLIGNSVYTCGEEPLGRDLTTTDLVAVNTRLTEIDARVRDLIEDGKYSLVKSYLKIPYRRAGLGDSDEPVIHAKLFLDKLDANTIGSDKHLQEVESLVGEANKLTQQKLELDAAEEDGGATPALVSFINSEGVDESHSITTIAGGTNFVVALSKDGTVFFFGKMKFDDTDWCYIDKENGMSVFADGNNLTPIELVLPSSKAKAINLFAGPEYFYIHLEDGTLLSAGFGAHGQLLRKGAFSKDDTGTVDFGTNAGPPAPKYDVKKVHDALIPDICNPTFVNMAGRAQRMTGGKIAKVAAGKDHCLMLC